MNRQDCPLCYAPRIFLFAERKDPLSGVRRYWRCGICALIFLSPALRLPSKEEKARYDCHQNSPDDEGYVNFLSRLTDPLRQRLHCGASGLDFGCGPGPAVSVILAREGFEVRNYDPFYFPDKSLLERRYDFVTCTETAEHFFEPRKEFLLIDDLLKEGGFLGIMTQIYEGRPAFEAWWYPKDPTHVCFYQKETFEWIAGWRQWSLDFPEKNVAVFRKEKKAAT